jgi:hypothetical protein
MSWDKEWDRIVDGARSRVDMSGAKSPNDAAILHADSVIRRAKDVEGMAEVLERLPLGSRTASGIARAVRDYLMGEG